MEVGSETSILNNDSFQPCLCLLQLCKSKESNHHAKQQHRHNSCSIHFTEEGRQTELILLFLFFTDGSGSDEKLSAFEASIQGKSWSEIVSLQQSLRISNPHQLLLMLYYIEQDPAAPRVIIQDGLFHTCHDITSLIITVSVWGVLGLCSPCISTRSNERSVVRAGVFFPLSRTDDCRSSSAGASRSLTHHTPPVLVVWHCLFMRRGRGLRRDVQAHFFFPLLRTETVLRTIHSMWQLICSFCHWDCPPLEHILDRNYRFG